VRVYYPFHPLHGRELEVFASCRSADGAVTVEDRSGRRLKIPRWMVATDAAQCELSREVTLDARSLLLLVELMELHGDKLPAKEVSFQEECRESTLVTGANPSEGTGSRDSTRSKNA
jgi:hypothetical protein